MAKYSSKDVGFFLLGSYSLLGSTTKIEDTVELKLTETYVLGDADEAYWSSGAKKTDVTQDGWFDDAAGSVHAAFSGLSTVALPMTIAFQGNTVATTGSGTPVDIYQSVQRVGYDVQLTVGEVTKAVGRYGIWYGKKGGKLAFPLQTKTTAGNGDTDPDNPIHGTNPAGTNGGAMVLHITALSGCTDCTITLRHSTDGTTYSDKTAFSAFTPANVTAGIASEYKALSGTINRFTTAGWAYTSPSSPSVTFAIGVYVAP